MKDAKNSPMPTRASRAVQSTRPAPMTFVSAFGWGSGATVGSAMFLSIGDRWRVCEPPSHGRRDVTRAALCDGTVGTS